MNKTKIKSEEEKLSKDLKKGRFDNLEKLAIDAGFERKINFSDLSGFQEYKSKLAEKRDLAHRAVRRELIPSNEFGIFGRKYYDLGWACTLIDFLTPEDDKPSLTREGELLDMGVLQDYSECYDEGFIRIRNSKKDAVDLIAVGMQPKKQFRVRCTGNDTVTTRAIVKDAMEISRENPSRFIYLRKNVEHDKLTDILVSETMNYEPSKMFYLSQEEAKKISSFEKKTGVMTLAGLTGIGLSCMGFKLFPFTVDYVASLPDSITISALVLSSLVTAGYGLCNAVARGMINSDKEERKNNLSNPNLKYRTYAIEQLIQDAQRK